MTDSGVGIEASKLDGLFRAFTKIQRFRELNVDGCGLGLTKSKNIASAMGGDISVASAIGKGSVFTVTLPLRISKDEPTTLKEARSLDGICDISLSKFAIKDIIKVPFFLQKKANLVTHGPQSSESSDSDCDELPAPLEKSLVADRRSKLRVLVVDDDPFNIVGATGLL